jgi:hypothetical protein
MILEILKGTPWWVYVLFVYLIFIGFKARYSKDPVSMIKLVILPLLFNIWSIYSLITKYEITLSTTLIWFFVTLFGFGIGWWMTLGVKIKVVNKKKGLIKLPNTWSTLILVLIIFVSKYTLGVLLGMNPAIKDNIVFYSLDLIISGAIAGVFLGRFLCLFSKYRKTQSS